MRISDWSSDVCSSDLLPGQDEPLLIAREEIELALEVVLPRGDVPVELVELDKAEGGPDLRRFQIVAEFLEQELGVIGNAVQLHVEACLDAFGLHEERRGAAPGAEQQRAAAKLVIVDADHATVARGVDDVRSVEAGGADVRPVAGACAAKRGAKSVEIGRATD